MKGKPWPPKAVADTAQVIVNTAKVEIDFIKATGNPGGSNFIPLAERKLIGDSKGGRQ